MRSSQQDRIEFVARAFLSLIFILSGLQKILAWDAMQAYMASRGLPMIPVLLALATAIELIGGVSLVVGYRTRQIAGALFLYLIPVTLVFHSFWTFSGVEAQAQATHFLKNLTILGGLLHVSAYGAGRISLDGRREMRLRSEPGASASIDTAA